MLGPAGDGGEAARSDTVFNHSIAILAASDAATIISLQGGRKSTLFVAFGIDLEHCSQCGDDLKIIAAIEETAVIANTVRLPVSPAGDIVGNSEKDGLNFLYFPRTAFLEKTQRKFSEIPI